MTTLREELDKVLAIKDEAACAEAFQKFCRDHEGSLPLPGQDTRFDKAMWAASQFFKLSNADHLIVNKVTQKLMSQSTPPVSSAVLKLKDLVGSSKEAAIALWQDMLAAMSWQPMVPAGALRGVGSQMVSLGTFERQFDDVNVQLNLGWLVNEDRLKVLMQARNAEDVGISAVEVSLTEAEKGIVFSRKTNEDGTVVAPNVEVKPGTYKIQVSYKETTVETPYFVL